MNEADEKRYLAAWGCECFICKKPTVSGDKTLQHTIVQINKAPEHADPEYIQYYMACQGCVDKGELV